MKGRKEGRKEVGFMLRALNSMMHKDFKNILILSLVIYNFRKQTTFRQIYWINTSRLTLKKK